MELVHPAPMSVTWSYFGRVAREGREMITGVNPNPKRISLTMTEILMGRESFSSAARPAAAAAAPNGCPPKDPRALVAHSVGPPKP